MHRLSYRRVTLATAGIGVVALLAVALLPVPYVILSPGPTLACGVNGGHACA